MNHTRGNVRRSSWTRSVESARSSATHTCVLCMCTHFLRGGFVPRPTIRHHRYAMLFFIQERSPDVALARPNGRQRATREVRLLVRTFVSAQGSVSKMRPSICRRSFKTWFIKRNSDFYFRKRNKSKWKSIYSNLFTWNFCVKIFRSMHRTVIPFSIQKESLDRQEPASVWSSRHTAPAAAGLHVNHVCHTRGAQY